MLVRAIVVSAVVALAACGCTPMSTFQPPHVLEEDETAFGLGAVQVLWNPAEDSDDTGFFPSFWYRTAVADRMDMGVKVGLWEGVALDLKRELLRGDFTVSADMQIACVGFDGNQAVILRPAAIAGTRHLYGGVWWNLPLSEECWDQMTGFMVGASFGRRHCLMLEYNWFREKWARDGSMSFGLAFQARSGGRDDH